MRYGVQWIDVRPYINSGQSPVYLLDRPLAHGADVRGGVFSAAEVGRLGEHWVPQANVAAGVPWSLTRVGDKVRIPVFAYRIDRSLASIWGIGLQIGLAAMEELRQHTSDIPHTAVLVLGHEVTDLQDAFRVYAGIALQTK